MVKMIKGDLFQTDCKCLVHCISLDCKMGKGIAYTFNKNFPSMKKDLLSRVNERYLYKSIEYIKDDKVIINMITKRNYFDKPKYKDFITSLLSVAKICRTYNIKTISMPKIGCGLDRLDWDRVKGILEHFSNENGIDILVYYL